jgi:RNA polymerase sigma-70 factor (ECF subfamily)
MPTTLSPPQRPKHLSDQFTKPNSEPPILPTVATGDPEAIAICLDRFGGLVWSLARRFCKDQQVAEDAVQDIFIQIWQSAQHFDPSKASESTFVAMIARRRLIDRYRKANNRKQIPVVATDFIEVASKTAAVGRRVELDDEIRIAESFLAELPEKQQQAIRMNIYDGFSHSQIAELTGLSLGTVKTNIRRGLSFLREQLFARESERRGGV